MEIAAHERKNYLFPPLPPTPTLLHREMRAISAAASLLFLGAMLLPHALAATAETLDLDADDVPSNTDKAEPADFAIPVKVNGKQVSVRAGLSCPCFLFSR